MVPISEIQIPEIQRQYFFASLASAIECARQDASNVGLLLIDLTNLARLNHNHGYLTGDEALAEIQGQLLSVSKLPDTVFRVGSHRFAFVLPGLVNPAYIALALNKVTSILSGEARLTSHEVSLEIKIGFCVNRLGESEPLDMFASAESSLDQVKLGESHHFEEALGERPQEQLNYRQEERFIEALRENDFELHYQPKVRLSDGHVDSAEALLRWKTDSGEMVSPEIAVATAERVGRSFELTKWIVHQAMRQLREWHGTLDIGLAVNIQAGLVGNPDLLTLLRDSAAIWGVDAKKVTVEITENAIIEDKEAGFNNLSQIRDSGFNLSIDDFGTGYSSLSYFKHIPASELKIDKSFIDSLLADGQDLELVKIMIHIAHEFGLSVVAEGIEDFATMELLRDLGCDYGQGFYFTQALASKEFEAWLSTRL